jgi:hypothetical protein
VHGDILSEGVIEYDITYPTLDSGLLGANMLPSTMILTFKDDKYKLETGGQYRPISLGFVSDGRSEKLDFFIKIINQRFISRFNKKGIRHLNQRLPPYMTEVLPDTAMIAGYECTGYRINYFSNFAPDYDLYTTPNIKIANPNWCTPYPKIEGVMLQYRLQYEGLVMQLKAVKVKAVKVKDADLDSPKDYKIISNPQIVRRLEELFSSI